MTRRAAEIYYWKIGDDNLQILNEIEKLVSKYNLEYFITEAQG